MKHILITGTLRSGTTFTGNILRMARSTVYIREPFNPSYGLSGVDCTLPYIRSEDSNDKYIRLIDDLFSFRASYRKNYSKDANLKKIVKFFLGTRNNMIYKSRGMFNKNTSRLLIKDGHAAFLSEYMSQKHDCQVIVTVRHPCAVMASFKQLGWLFNFNPTLLDRQSFFRKYFTEKEYEELIQHKERSYAIQVGLMWLCIYKVLVSYSRHPSFLIIKQEDVCLKPEEHFKKIFKWCNLEYTNVIKNEITKKTISSNPIRKRNNIDPEKVIGRDSQKLGSYWKDIVTHEERAILKKITEPVAQLYYSEASWL